MILISKPEAVSILKCTHTYVCLRIGEKEMNTK